MITSEQYLINKKRLKKAEDIMDKQDAWNDARYADWKKEYSKILEENLEYEAFYKINELDIKSND